MNVSWLLLLLLVISHDLSQHSSHDHKVMRLVFLLGCLIIIQFILLYS